MSYYVRSWFNPTTSDPWATLDGRLSAPVSTGNPIYNTITTPKQNLNFSTMLNRYSPVRPPWKVAGIDYQVGINNSALPLKDPANIATFVPGATFSNNQVTLPNSSSPITVDGFDFSLHNGTQLLLGTGTGLQTVQNCYFKDGSNLFNAIWDNGNIANAVLIQYCVFDGNAPAFLWNNPGLTAGNVSINGKSITILYSYFLNGSSEHIVTGGSVTAGTDFTCKYNVFSQSGYGGWAGAHGDIIQMYGGITGCNITNVTCSFNTTVIDDTNTNGDNGNVQAGAGWGMQGFSISSADNFGDNISGFRFQNNTFCGSANAAITNGLGAAWLINHSWFHGTIDASYNYVDYALVNGATLGWAIDYFPESQNGTGTPSINWNTGTNINLLNGASLQSRFGT